MMSLFVLGCTRPTPLQLAAGVSLSNQLIEEHVRSIQRQDFCRREEVSEILERTTIQEFDALNRLERVAVAASAGSDTETNMEYRVLDGGGLETEASTRVSLESGVRVSRQITRVDAQGRETFMSRDQTDDGTLELTIETSYAGDTETRVVTNGPNTTTTTTIRDEFDNVVSLVTAGSGSVHMTLTTYSDDGTRPLRQVSSTRGLGASEDLETTWTYNAAGFESSMVVTLGGARLRERTWDFDESASPIAVLDQEFITGGVRIRRDATVVYSGRNLVTEVGVRFIDGVAAFFATRRFEYDADRLVRETIETPEGTWEANWTWNGERLEGFRTSQGASFDVRRFRYDPMGRLAGLERETSDGYPIDTTWSFDCS